jgi:ATP-dependent HslUV protease, peptidase subunit HslV
MIQLRITPSTVRRLIRSVKRAGVAACVGLLYRLIEHSDAKYAKSLREPVKIRSTTILSVRRGDTIAIGGDGQVSLGQTIVKHDTLKLRSFQDAKVWCGFAGSAADAFALLDRFSAKLDAHKSNIRRAAIELAKEWRSDRVLRRLESLLVVASAETSLMISGAGDVIEPSDGIIGVGSGGMYAVAAARALISETELNAADIVTKSLNVAADICVYTNHNITVETVTL